MRRIAAMVAVLVATARTAHAQAPEADVPPDAPADTDAAQSEADKAAAEAAAAENAAAEQAAAEQAAAEQAAAEKAAAEKAAAEKATADKAAADKAAADKAAAAKTGGATAFDGGYTDEIETVAPRVAADDPYDRRPAVAAAFNLGFGVGRADDELAGLMVGGAGLRVGPARIVAELSGGTSLSHLDVTAGAELGWGMRRYHGLAARIGYARGFRVREDLAVQELRADIGLASVQGFSWLSGRVRVDDAYSVTSFFFVVEIERVR